MSAHPIARLILAATAAVALAATTACSPAADPAEPSTPPSPTAEIADTPAGEKTRWIIEVLEAPEDTTAEQWQTQLQESFRAQVSAQEVADLLNRQIRPAAPFEVVAYRGSDREAVTTLRGTVGDPVDLSLAIDADGLITGLSFTPAAEPWRASTSFDEIGERLDALPGEISVLIRRSTADGTDLRTILSEDADRPRPIASAFKLAVLSAVADQVRDGLLSWEDTVTVTDSARSLPSGTLQDAPTGTTVTVREASIQMISISDNTATDLLIERVGRRSVEEAMRTLGFAEPERNVPLLSTKALFTLGWGPRELSERWDGADEQGRRALLDEIEAAALQVSAADVRGVRWTDGLEWFASAADLARAHAALAAMDDPVVTEALERNPGAGLDIDRSAYPEIAFKGGSDLGVVSGSWRAQTADGEILTVVVIAASEDATALAAAQRDLFHLVEDAFRLAAS